MMIACSKAKITQSTMSRLRMLLSLSELNSLLVHRPINTVYESDVALRGDFVGNIDTKIYRVF
jgi:hypothetical protein